MFPTHHYKELKMIEMLKKNAYVGLGLVAMTQSKIMELGKKIAEESKLPEEEGRKFVGDLLKQADESKAALQEQVTKIVEKTVSSMKLPCTSHFEKLETDVKSLHEAIARLEEKISKLN